ncbi:MAG: anti-sigma factor [Rhizobiaceae bacterium]
MSDEHDMERSDRALAAEYVLGVLPHAERRVFAARLDEDEALQDEVRFWTEQLSPLADETEAVEPPAAVFDALETRLFAPAQAAKAGWWSSLAFWRGLAVASLAALVLAGVYLASTPGPRPEQPSYVAEISSENGALKLVAFVDAEAGVIRINRTEGVPESGRDFELWLIEGSNAPVSLGVLPGAARSSHEVPEDLTSRLSGAVLAISDEPKGGSPTGQPTGAVLAAGTVVEI